MLMTAYKESTSCYATIALILIVQILYITYTYTSIDHISINVEQVNQGEVNVSVELKLNNSIPPPHTTQIHTQLEQSPTPSKKPTFEGPSRPLDGYLLDISRVNESCEPKSYEKEAFEEYRIQSCLDFLSKNESEYIIKPKNSTSTYEGKEMLFHVYWKGKLNDKISLMIKSFLYTQPLNSSVLNVWMDSNDEDLTKNQDISSFLKFSNKTIYFKKWNATEQLNHYPIYKGWKKILRKNFKKIGTVGYSDMVRFILLHRYGGLYVDADVLLLRDMRPLYHLNYEWSYRWSEWFDYNTAVLRIFKESTTSHDIITGAMKNKMNFHPTKIKHYLVKKKKITSSDVNKRLYMMSVTMFDPLWLKSDLLLNKQVMVPNLSQFKDVFKTSLLEDEFPGVNETVAANTTGANVKSWRKKEKFFNGAFTYHWHNQWNKRIYGKSWMGILGKGYDDFLKGRKANLYNEYIVI